ncbi:MAG: class I SAM-dependent methyltransferase [Candidatus Woesearchaeota archaeon]|jgi:predicted O-methyltransferase YrrM|nr:class I SAM-dependent methyltransferase [Candidatus Woesearchaeota archaeon]
MSNIILNKLNSLQKQKQNSKFWNITYEQGIFLSNLIEIKNPKRILEIGTSNGFSTLFLSKNLNKDSIIDTIEVNEERYNLAKKNFESCNLSLINSHLGKAFDILPKLKNTYDFIFIDALQAQYLDLLKEIEKLKITSKDLTIIFDNVGSHENMQEFTDYVKIYYHTEFIGLGGGMLYATKSTL